MTPVGDASDQGRRDIRLKTCPDLERKVEDAAESQSAGRLIKEIEEHLAASDVLDLEDPEATKGFEPATSDQAPGQEPMDTGKGSTESAAEGLVLRPKKRRVRWQDLGGSESQEEPAMSGPRESPRNPL